MRIFPLIQFNFNTLAESNYGRMPKMVIKSESKIGKIQNTDIFFSHATTTIALWSHIFLWIIITTGIFGTWSTNFILEPELIYEYLIFVLSHMNGMKQRHNHRLFYVINFTWFTPLWRKKNRFSVDFYQVWHI